MNLRDLQYLVALADHCHFGRAAEACFVSQPALSMQIKKLEEYLDIQLIERTNKSVLLTSAGILLVERARSILNQAEEMRALAKSASDPYSGELRVGIIPTLAPYLLPHIIPALTAKFPKLILYLVEEQTAVILEKLKQGQLDTAVLALPVHEAGLTSVALFTEEFMLAVPGNHALAERKKIKSADLANKKVLLLEEGHCLRDQALAVCAIAHARETANFRATSLETLRHMVASGAGVTFMPKLACKPNDGITYLAFSAPKPSRTIGMLWRTATARAILLNEIATCIKKVM